MAETAAHVLVVDDDPVNRTLLARTLERDGHLVTTAEDGAEAWELLQREPFDVVLLDVLMPKMDGCEVLEHIEEDAQLHRLPVIMISALDELETVVRCIELGALDYLPKPFNPVLLRARINAGLTKKRLRDLELEYIEQVGLVVDAAAAVEAGTFDPEPLAEVAGRADALGQLARVFRRMAEEVQARERRLREQVEQLQIEINEARAERQVAEITESDYFRDLQTKVEDLRLRDER